MTLLAATIMDVSVVLLAALAAVAALRRRSAALRHWILTAAVACALATPALELTLPTWSLPAGTSQWATTIVAPGTLAVFESIVTNGASASPSASDANLGRLGRPSLKVVLLGLWGIGAIAALSILAVRLARLKHLSRRVARVDDPRCRQLLHTTARLHGITRSIELLHSRNPAMVVTWGLIRPRVLVPEDAPRLERCADSRGPLARARARAPERLEHPARGRRAEIRLLVSSARVDGCTRSPT